jgi:hypothetical protein
VREVLNLPCKFLNTRMFMLHISNLYVQIYIVNNYQVKTEYIEVPTVVARTRHTWKWLYIYQEREREIVLLA